MWVVISTEKCTYCDKAKELLKKKGYPFVEYNITSASSKWLLTLVNIAKLKTVPQVFKPNGTLVGGYTELKEYLDESSTQEF